MPYRDYSFTAFTGSALFGGGSDARGTTFTVPDSASVEIAVSDDDSILSGDLRWNEHADDLHVSGALITNNDGQSIGNGGKVFGDNYVVVQDRAGNEFRMVRIEQQGTNDTYYAFDDSYGVPSEGTELTVTRTYDVNKWFGNIPRYHELTAGDLDDPQLPEDPHVDNTASISDRLFLDDNKDGSERDDDGNFEGGLSGQPVELLNYSGDVIATTTTGRDGAFEFTDLEAGRYSVRFQEAEGYEFTQSNYGDNRYDSDVRTDSGETGTILLRSGHHMDNIDAGLVEPHGSISGTVWIDADCDGIQDGSTETPGEIVMRDMGKQRADFTKNVTVEEGGVYELTYDQIASRSARNMFENEVELYVNGVLIDSNTHKYKNEHDYRIELQEGENEITFRAATNFTVRKPSIDDIVLQKIDVTEGEAGREGIEVKLLNTSGEVVAETVTDAEGNYHFEDLPQGEYTVMGVAPDGTEFTIQDAGSDDSVDSDVNANGGSTVNVTGHEDIDMGLCEVEPDTGTASIGDRVWKDWNENGVQDEGEWGFPDLMVTLMEDTDGDGVADEVVDTTTTGFDGKYLFENLDAGEYAVLFGKPAYYEFTQDGDAADDALDGDSDADWGGMTEVFTLSDGEEERDIDAGVVPNWDGYVPPLPVGNDGAPNTDMIQSSTQAAEAGTAQTDGEATGAITYSLGESPDSFLFDIDAASGAITPKEWFTPSLEDSWDENGDYIYELTRVATPEDGGDPVAELVQLDTVAEGQLAPLEDDEADSSAGPMSGEQLMAALLLPEEAEDDLPAVEEEDELVHAEW